MKVESGNAGQLVQCPSCQTALRVPGSSDAPTATKATPGGPAARTSGPAPTRASGGPRPMATPQRPVADPFADLGPSHSSGYPSQPAYQQTYQSAAARPAYWSGAPKKDNFGLYLTLGIVGLVFVLLAGTGVVVFPMIRDSLASVSKSDPSAASETRSVPGNTQTDSGAAIGTTLTPASSFVPSSGNSANTTPGEVTPVVDQMSVNAPADSSPSSSTPELMPASATPAISVSELGADFASDSERPASPFELKELIEQIEPSVVRVDVKSEEGDSIGSGFVVSQSGLVVTNYHVVEGAKEIKVTFNSRQTANVTGFVDVSSGHDICILQIDSVPPGVKPLRIAKTAPPKGERVAAFGCPHGFDFSATEGIISAVRSGESVQATVTERVYSAVLGYTTDTEWVQTSTAISGGNSGGPLVDMYGDVVAMNTFGSSEGQNLNFAVSASTIIHHLQTRSQSVSAIASIPKRDNSKLASGVLAEIFGTEEKIPANDLEFVKSSGGDEVRKFSGHTKGVFDLDISSDGKYLASCSLDNHTYVFDLTNGKALYGYKTSEFSLVDLQFAAGSKYLITFRNAGVEDSIVYRDPATGDSLPLGFGRLSPKEASVLAVTPDARTVFACWLDGTSITFRYDSLMHSRLIGRLEHSAHVGSATFTNDGQLLAIGGYDGGIVCYNMTAEGPELKSRQDDAHKSRVTDLSPRSDHRAIASVGEDGAVNIWTNMEKSDKWRGIKLAASGAEALGVCFSPDDSLLAVARSNGTAELWNVARKKIVQKLAAGSGAVTVIKFMPSGQHVVTGCADGTVRIFHVNPE